MPTLYKNGVPITPVSALVYYRGGNKAGPISPFPQGLRLIAGDAHAMANQSANTISWACQKSGNTDRVYPPTAAECGGGNGITMQIRFPDCWNGRDLDSTDHKSHFAYAGNVAGARACPASHPIQEPQLQILVHVNAFSPGITLSSGPYHTAHADFFNAWEPAELQRLITDCVTASTDCGLGDPRPGGATPLRVPLVPAYQVCNAPNSQHVGPLDSPSCTPVHQASNLLTTSTTGKGLGFARFDVINGDLTTPANEADVAIRVSATDVVDQASGFDYVGQVLPTTSLRITDMSNGSGNVSGTVQDFDFSFPSTCLATPDPATGSACAATTTANTLVPGMIQEHKRTIMRTSSVRMRDAGADGVVTPPSGTCPPTCGSGDEGTFLDQGVFAP